jgi:hypothetical protein
MASFPWFRRRGGRGLIDGRARRRPTAIGACPSCGEVLTAATEHWFDAESVVAAHLLGCTAAVPVTAQPVTRPFRAVVRPA